jgi:dTDP-glucose 4,6-dehydratase
MNTLEQNINKKVCLLTGIGGSIGIHCLSQIMKNTDWDVVGIDSFNHRGWCDRVESHLKNHPDDVSRVRIITHDLVAPFSELTKKRIGKVDYIINMASLSDVEASIQEPVPFVKNNISLVLNMLEFAREAKPQAFIQISTDEVYGPTTGKNDGYKEWDAQVPSNPYAASKAAQEAIAISYWRAYGVPLIITNTMNNYAEMQSSTKFPVMIQKAIMNDEEITIHGNEKGEIGSRSYIHSQNFCNALLFILKNLPPYLHENGKVDKPDRYHIAGEKQLDNLELAKLIAELMGKELKYKIVNFHNARPGHDPHYGLNDDKLKNLGWKIPVSFEESLKNVIKWQTEHEDWIK